MAGHHGETAVSCVVNQLNIIFTCIEIKWNKSLELENNKLSDLHAGWHNGSYDRLGPPQGVPSVLADIWETAQNHMTKYSIWTKKNDKGTVLDSPLKGKTTETCFAEGVMSIVQPAPRTSQASGHLSIF